MKQVTAIALACLGIMLMAKADYTKNEALINAIETADMSQFKQNLRLFEFAEQDHEQKQVKYLYLLELIDKEIQGRKATLAVFNNRWDAFYAVAGATVALTTLAVTVLTAVLLEKGIISYFAQKDTLFSVSTGFTLGGIGLCYWGYSCATQVKQLAHLHEMQNMLKTNIQKRSV